MKRRLAKKILVANEEWSGLSHPFTLFAQACERFNRLHPADRERIEATMDRRHDRWAKEHPVEVARLAAERDESSEGGEVEP